METCYNTQFLPEGDKNEIEAASKLFQKMTSDVALQRISVLEHMVTSMLLRIKELERRNLYGG